MTQSDKPRQLEAGEFLFTTLRVGREALWAPWALQPRGQRESYARAEAACIARGRAEADAELTRAVKMVTHDRNSHAQWVRDLEAELREIQAAAPRWIPTSERLPTLREWVMFVSAGSIFTGLLTREGWMSDSGGLFEQRFVTHWMPLPKLPSEET